MKNNLFSTISPKQQLYQSVYEWLLTVLLVVVVGIFQFTRVDRSLLLLGREAVSPLLSFNTAAASSLNKFALGLRQQYLLARRVQDLEIKLANTYAQMGELELLEEENQELRDLLNSTDRTLNRVVLTQPILSFAQPVVDIPRDIELTVGSAVLVEGTLVGVVAETKQDVALINLLWQKDAAPVLASSSGGVQGIVRGDGRRVLFTEVPIDAQLEVGQRVVTAGQRGIDRGLFIGEVRSVVSGDSAAVKTAVLEQYISFYQARLVEIRL